MIDKCFVESFYIDREKNDTQTMEQTRKVAYDFLKHAKIIIVPTLYLVKILCSCMHPHKIFVQIHHLLLFKVYGK